HLMRNDHNLLLAIEKVLDGLDQLRIEIAKVMLRRGKQRIRMLLQIRCLQMELGELEVQTLQRNSGVGNRTQIANNVEAVLGDDESLKAISDRVVLHEDFVSVE